MRLIALALMKESGKTAPGLSGESSENPANPLLTE
jgi:hypothetical protein